MRILTLNAATERLLLRARESRDLEAERVAAKIIAAVRRNGDAALASYANKFDNCDIRRTGLWITPKEIAAAYRRVSPQFIKAVKHAARNVQVVAEKQLPAP